MTNLTGQKNVLRQEMPEHEPHYIESGEKRKGPIFLHYAKNISAKSRSNVRPVTGELRFLFNRWASPVSERLTHLLKRAATGQNSPVPTQIRCSQRLALRRLQPCGLYP